MHYIVAIIDELADLMMVAPAESNPDRASGQLARPLASTSSLRRSDRR